MKHKGKMFTTMNSLMNVLEETAFFSYIYLFVGGGGGGGCLHHSVCVGVRGQFRKSVLPLLGPGD